MKKKVIKIEKRKIFCAEKSGMGYCPFVLQKKKLYCRKKNQCITMGIVLQDGCRRPKCVAIQNCIVTRGVGTGRRLGAGLGVAAGAQGGLGVQVGAGRALGAQAAGRWARRRTCGRTGGRQQARACRRWARVDARQGAAAAGRRAGKHGVGARGARPGRASARRLGVLAGSAWLVWCIVHLAQL